MMDWLLKLVGLLSLIIAFGAVYAILVPWLLDRILIATGIYRDFIAFMEQRIKKRSRPSQDGGKQ